MKELTISELQEVSGGNGWRIAFDIAGGGLAGTVIGAIYGAVQGSQHPIILFAEACIGGMHGLGIGLVAGGIFALARESFPYQVKLEKTHHSSGRLG